MPGDLGKGVYDVWALGVGAAYLKSRQGSSGGTTISIGEDGPEPGPDGGG